VNKMSDGHRNIVISIMLSVVYNKNFCSN